jgi:hypothetical protein
MKKISFYSWIILFAANTAFAQSPYSISPNWVFGMLGRLNFPTGDYPIAGAPTQGNTTLNQGCEASTAISFKNNTMAFYTNTRKCLNGGNALIRDFEVTDNTCSGSATAGGVTFPDPARNDYPIGNISNDAFYIVLGNDMTGGSCGSKGLNRYRFTGATSAAVAYNAGPNNIEVASYPSEALTVATDGVNGYWVITHTKGLQNTFRVWHYTTTAVTGPTDYQVGADFFSDNAGSQSYLKVSPCQDKVAFMGGNTISICSFDKSTGVVGGELKRLTGTTSGPGLEFSPLGTRIFYSGLGLQVNWANIVGATTGSVASCNSWSMQLGPDGNLYTSGQGSGNTNIGVIANPDAATPTFTNIALTGGASIFNGFVNQSWLSPESPFVNTPTGAGCDRTVSFDFENYFNTDIPVNAGTIIWNFGDGSGNLSGLGLTPTHTFPSTGSTVGYTITVTFDDSYCGHTWTANRIENVNCPLPVQLLNFSGASRNNGVLLSWQTATELNNEYFDLQRSIDGANFESIYKRAGAGNSNGLLSYQYIDPYEGTGIVYYRLVQHDFDGKTSVSRVIAIQLSNIGKAPVSIVPNPFSESVVLTKLMDEEATIIIYDMLGRTLESKKSSFGESVVYMGSHLSKGSYLISYISSQSTYTQKVEKQ